MPARRARPCWQTGGDVPDIAPGQFIAPLRARGSLSLRLGIALFVVLTLVNLAAYSTEQPASDTYLRFAPSHVAALRALLGGGQVQDTVTRQEVGFTGVFGNASASEPSAEPDTTSSPLPKVYESEPDPVARVGVTYQYAPATRVVLRDYRVQVTDKADPAASSSWMTADAQSGVISGTPDRVGTYDVSLTGTMDDGRAATQRFTLWVDNRFLLFGTDNNGRDIAHGVFLAARSTIVPAAVAVLIAVGLGVLVGAISGYYGGLAARSSGGLSAIVQSVPGLLLIALAGRMSDWNLLVMMAAVGLVMLPETASGVRELVERFRRRDFVEAARELGMRDTQILWNEIIWHNGRRFIASRMCQAFTFAVLTEVTLSFLGLTDPLTPSMGRLLLVGRENEFRASMMVPALAYLMLVISCFALLERGLILRWSRRR